MKYNTKDLFEMINANNETVNRRLDDIEKRLEKLENAKISAPKKSAVEKTAIYVNKDGKEVACTEAQKKNWEARKERAISRAEGTAQFYFMKKWKEYLVNKCNEAGKRLDKEAFKTWINQHVDADMIKWEAAGKPVFWK